MTADEEKVECALCGTHPVDDEIAWFALDFAHLEGSTERHWYRGFCSQDHAAAWMAGPASDPDQVILIEPADGRWWQDWELYAVILGLLAVLGFTGYGVYALFAGLLSR